MTPWREHRKYTGVAAFVLASLLAAAVLQGIGPTPSADAATLTLAPVADTTVDESAPTATAGSAPLLSVDGSPVKQVLMRFDLRGVDGTIQGARLRLHVANVKGAESAAGGVLGTSPNTSWPETGTSWNTRPAISGAPLATIGPVPGNAWVETTVTGGVVAGQVVTFAITSTHADAAIYDSRESDATAPRLVLTTGAATTTPSTTTTTLPPRPVTGPVVAAAGDAVCAPGGVVSATTCRQTTVSDLIVNNPGVEAFLALGNLQYENGALTDFQRAYDPSYGRVKAKTRPVPGNHEYDTTGAPGYYAYFGAAAGDPTKGYYSFDIGDTWHVVALNSNCSSVACAAASAQEQWLRADLAASTRPCTIAYWHHPRFSSATSHGNDPRTAPFWDALQQDGAEIVLNGHAHVYERYTPQLPDATPDANGIRQFIAGTGGKDLDDFATPVANSVVRISGFGVVELTLGADQYLWRFVNEAGSVLDSGTGTCH